MPIELSEIKIGTTFDVNSGCGWQPGTRVITNLDEDNFWYVNEDGDEFDMSHQEMKDLLKSGEWFLKNTPNQNETGYKLGDRFTCHHDNSMGEIIGFGYNGEIEFRWTDTDETTVHPAIDVKEEIKWNTWTHISGPTWKKPVPKPVKTCNCHWQITGAPHGDYCRTLEKT